LRISEPKPHQNYGFLVSQQNYAARSDELASTRAAAHGGAAFMTISIVMF
jgi:hypothetical protein